MRNVSEIASQIEMMETLTSHPIPELSGLLKLIYRSGLERLHTLRKEAENEDPAA